MIFLSVHAWAMIVHGKLQRFPPISVRPEYVTQSAYANECLSVCLSHSLCPSVLHMQWSWVSPPACGRISMRCSADTCGTEAAAPPAPAPPKHPLPSHTHTQWHTHTHCSLASANQKCQNWNRILNHPRLVQRLWSSASSGPAHMIHSHNRLKSRITNRIITGQPLSNCKSRSRSWNDSLAGRSPKLGAMAGDMKYFS